MVGSLRSIWVICGLFLSATVTSAYGDEIWVAPTYQQDIGGLGIGSNVTWPASPVGAVRFAWAIPNDLQTFQSAKIVLVPHTATANPTLNVFVCPAQNGTALAFPCGAPAAPGFTSVANQLTEVDVTAAVAAGVNTAGATYLAVLAYTMPSTLTDHIVGLRFTYAPKAPTGVATLAANTFTGTQTAPAFVGDGSGLTNLPPGPAGPPGPPGPPGSTGPAGPASVAALGSRRNNTVLPTTTLAFVSPPAPLTLASGQLVLVSGQITLGTSSASLADGLRLWICYQQSGGALVTPHGFDWISPVAAPGTANVYTLTDIVTGLAAGSYNFGLCGQVVTSPNLWNKGDWAYTTAQVLAAGTPVF